MDLSGHGPEQAGENHRRIQAALQPGASVQLQGSGRLYVNDTLLLPSGSTLSLEDGLILTAAPHLNKPLLRNASPELGNRDIRIRGGTLDYDCDNQSPKGGTLGTMAAIFHNVQHLHVSGMTCRNARKYVFLAAACSDAIFSDLDFDTPSDGIHIQGPARNITIRNVAGRTGDDMVAFTIGDYEGYEISRGDIEGVLVENLAPRGSKSAVKLAGNPGFVFRKIVLRGIRGQVRDFFLICLIDRNLNETMIEDIEVHNIEAAIVTDRPAIFVGRGTHIRDLSITGARFEVTDTDAGGSILHFNHEAIVDSLTLRRIELVGNGRARPGRVRALFRRVVLDDIRLQDMQGHLAVEQVGGSPCDFASTGYSFDGEAFDLKLGEPPASR